VSAISAVRVSGAFLIIAKIMRFPGYYDESRLSGRKNNPIPGEKWRGRASRKGFFSCFSMSNIQYPMPNGAY
jgi:hypothetical protein